MILKSLISSNIYIQKVFNIILKNNYFIAGLLFFLTSIFYSNLLQAGFLGDDAYNSQIAGKLIDEGVSLSRMTFLESMGWLNNGSIRFTFYYLIYPLFYYVTDIQYFKLISIFMLFFVNFSFYLFFSRLVRCNKLGLLATLFLFILIQYRPWHDPVLGFPSYQLPFISALMFMSFYFYIQFLDNNKKVLNLISLILLIFCLCMYEATLPFIPVFGILAFTQNKTFINSFKDIRYHFLIVSIYFIIIIYLKLFIVDSMSYQGASINLSNITDLVMALIKQVYAVFPLSYSIPLWVKEIIFNKVNPFTNFSEIISNLFPSTFLSWITLIVLLVLFFYCSKLVKLPKDKIYQKKVIFIFLNLLIVPAVLTAVSGHQKEVAHTSWGLAYLPIFIQYFGLSLIMTYVLTVVLNKQNNVIKKKYLILVFSTIYFFIASTTLNVNNRIINNELPKRFSLDLIQQSFNSGFYNVITPKDVLLRQMKYPQDWLWFYFQNLGFKIPLCEIVNEKKKNNDYFDKCIDFSEVEKSPLSLKIKEIKSTNAWVTAYAPDFINGVNGIVFMSKINKVLLDEENNPISIYADNIRIYNQIKNEIKVIENINIDFMKIVRSEFLYNNYEDFNLDDINNDISFNTYGKIEVPQGNITNFFQWVSGNVIIKIYNNSKVTKKAEIHIEVFSPDVNTKKINLLYGKEINQYVEFNNKEKINKIKMTLLPGENIFKINTNSEAVKNNDPRNIIYGLKNLKITEIKK